MPACKNGFFIRDDVPARFFTTNYWKPYPDFYINNSSSWNTTSEYNHFTNGKSGINYMNKPCFAISSGSFAPDNLLPSNAPQYPNMVPNYNASYIPISYNDKETMKAIDPNHDLSSAMSQDQVYRLLLGFSTVIRSIPNVIANVDTDDDGIEDTPFNFVEEAKIHCTNMIARLNGVSSNINDIVLNNELSCSQSIFPSFFNRWFCKDPLFQKPGIGNNSWVYSPAVTRIWQMYYSNNHTIPNLNSGYVATQTFSANSPTSVANTVNFLTQIFTTQEPSNSKLFLYSSLVSGYIPYFVSHDAVFNRLFEISRGNINHQFKYFGWHTYMMPLYCYLHQFHPQNNTAKDNWLQTRTDMTFEVMSAPCWGPYNYVNVDTITKDATANFTAQYGGGNWIAPMGANGWSTSFRFDQRAYKTIHGFQDNWADNGFFNGIDYMSEVDLYYITSNTYTSQPTSLPFYQNLIDRYVDYDVSSDNTPMLGAFNTLTIVKTISGSGQLDIQAGSSIDLKDGTHITTSQPSKHLFIKTFSCNNIYSGGYELPVVSDSTLEANSQYWAMNNDYGFNEEFPIKQYDVKPIMSNAPTADEISVRLQANTEENSDSIVLYPNPTQKEFSIKSYENTSPVDCKVYLLSTDGKNIQIGEIRGKYDISTLSPGTYTVHLLFPTGAVADKKLIILP